MVGSGVTVVGSQDAGTYSLPGATVSISPNGFYILNSVGSIYYENTTGTIVSIPGSAAAIAPTSGSLGGVFVLGYPANSSGTAMYYYNLNYDQNTPPGWTTPSGSAMQISGNSKHLYAVSSSNTIYASPTEPAGYGPADLQAAYALPSTTAGEGQTVAIVMHNDDPTAEADLAVYRSQYSLSPCTSELTGTPPHRCFTKVSQTGQTTDLPPTDVSAAQEISVDLDMVSAICPKCNILLVEAKDTPSDLGAAEDEAVTLGANVVSNSYGTAYNADLDIHYNHQGVAIVAASGDEGYGPVQFPAASPYVTAVGGTTLTRASNLRGWTETASSRAGSGCTDPSSFPYYAYTKQPWQTDLDCAYRMVADVSAVADGSTPVTMYDSTAAGTAQGWQYFAGTSVAAPIIAGVYALAGNASTVTTGINGYGSYPYGHTASLFDITSGNNGNSCPFYYYCNAQTGYDGPTGLGSPNGVGAF